MEGRQAAALLQRSLAAAPPICHTTLLPPRFLQHAPPLQVFNRGPPLLRIARQPKRGPPLQASVRRTRGEGSLLHCQVLLSGRSRGTAWRRAMPVGLPCSDSHRHSTAQLPPQRSAHRDSALCWLQRNRAPGRLWHAAVVCGPLMEHAPAARRWVQRLQLVRPSRTARAQHTQAAAAAAGKGASGAATSGSGSAWRPAAPIAADVAGLQRFRVLKACTHGNGRRGGGSVMHGRGAAKEEARGHRLTAGTGASPRRPARLRTWVVDQRPEAEDPVAGRSCHGTCPVCCKQLGQAGTGRAAAGGSGRRRRQRERWQANGPPGGRPGGRPREW